MLRSSVNQRFSVLLAVTVALLPGLASACSVCMGAADDNVVIGVNMAVVMLLGVTGAVLSSIAAFMVHLSRLAKKFDGKRINGQSKAGV